jgi:hypothetical protein
MVIPSSSERDENASDSLDALSHDLSTSHEKAEATLRTRRPHAAERRRVTPS